MFRSIRTVGRLTQPARLTSYVRHCSAAITSTSTAAASTSDVRRSTSVHAEPAAVVPSAANAPVARTSFGQPTADTHPHLLRAGELCAHVGSAEFADRRRRVLHSIQRFALKQNSALGRHLVVVPSANKRYMSDKIPFVFRQNSDFLYLSGCLEEDTVLLMWIDDTKVSHEALFMRPKDAHAELWDGPRTGVELAPQLFGVEQALPVGELRSFLAKFPTPFTLWFNSKTCDQPAVSRLIADLLGAAGLPKSESPTGFIHQQRLIKSAAEIQLMRRTCTIAAQAINETMRETRADVDSEHHIFARVEYKCRMAGASHLAYPPVVASGRNATVIHYVQNTQLVHAGDMVLMDAGCEYGGYSSDITRTWPAGGRFTDAQRVLYEVVWQLQRELIDTLGADGGRTLDALFDTMCLRLGQLLQEAGLLRRQLAGQDLVRAAFRFCPHHVSHYLGMDVHDTPLMSRQLPLRPGVVCTVEPGIYIAADSADVPVEFRGMGVRIEDDVLIGEDGRADVLTAECVREPRELEALLHGAGGAV